MKKIFCDMVFYLKNCLVMSTYLGQNFLKDSSMRSYIGSAIAKMYEEVQAQALMEIGPGKWAITRKIKDVSRDFFVVEKDLTMEPYLLEVWLEKKQIVFIHMMWIVVNKLLWFRMRFDKRLFLLRKKNLIYGGYWTGHMKSST